VLRAVFSSGPIGECYCLDPGKKQTIKSLSKRTFGANMPDFVS
jgi:hypothetical protein